MKNMFLEAFFGVFKMPKRNHSTSSAGAGRKVAAGVEGTGDGFSIGAGGLVNLNPYG